MYPSRFRYEAPTSIEEAIALLDEGKGEAKVLAGGQSLIPMLKLRFAQPGLLVDINNIPGLGYHHFDDAGAFARLGPAYDARRNETNPFARQREPERFGKAEDYGWREDKRRQYSSPQRAEFGAYLRGIGFSFD